MDLVAPTPYQGFRQARERAPAALALEIGPQAWTYAQLAEQAERLAGVLHGLPACPGDGGLVAVFASRSLTSYSGSLAVYAAGRAHLALNPAHPPARNAAILRRARANILIVAPEALSLAVELAEILGRSLTLITPLNPRDSFAHGLCRVIDQDEVAQATPYVAEEPPRAGDLAYVVFTSGSTGEPKGVAISHGNLAYYMRDFRALAAPLAEDRVAQTYELTFDVALHDMFNAWWSGATLCVMPERAMLAPARFILDQRISYWFSVASFAMILQRQNLLRPGVFPGLRVSLLCGEALPRDTAVAWAAAAPNSVLYNVYGPTETTMELAFYRWQAGLSEGRCRRGVVPVGVPFAGHAHLLLDEAGREIVGPGKGELYLSGPQIGLGYYADPERTAAAFVRLPGQPALPNAQGETLWYRTGDLIERDADGIYHFISRVDFQVKVRGNRIELGEVEAALREVTGMALAAVVPHPIVDGAVQGIVAFVAAPPHLSGTDIRRAVAAHLPKSMLPDEVRVLDEFPMNANRKIDRGALKAMLEQG